jgi:GTP diphosphokinase / guanosine-3',5'-bis(diphosphate) 3'-diphosphatase
MSKNIETLIKNSPNPALTRAVFEFAENAYKEMKKVSEENYIYHAVRVASVLNDMKLDQKTIDAALLHDVVDDLPLSAKKIHLEEIEKKFGKEIAFLVERASELNKIRYSLESKKGERAKLTEEKFENLKKMFFAEARDLRVIIIELASRLDNLRYLNYLAPEQQKMYAFETLKIFVPIAERLSLWGMKSQLEDLSFSYLLPERFAWLKSYVKAEYEERDRYLKSFVKRLQKILRGERINVIDLNWRPKSYWSTYQKLQNHDMDIEKIHDLLALKIIVKDVESCYKTLGIIHKYFKPLSEDINDYIAKPKTNGYRSLHTTVFCDKEQITEIQIKTPEMQQEAEYGVCAHWAYKEKVDLTKDREKFSLSKGIPDLLKTFKIDFYENKVFAFTPKGDVIILPRFSTPVDFAYAIHSDIGNHCETAKINGKSPAYQSR